MSDKDEATRLADALERGGYLGNACNEAAALLRRWPDAGEPVARIHGTTFQLTEHGQRNFPAHGTLLYTAPPDQSERIAALEAALKQAGDALEGLLRGCKRSTIQGLTGWHEKSMPSSEALDAGQDALRKIEGIQR